MDKLRGLLLAAAVVCLVSVAPVQASSITINLDTPLVSLMPGQTAIFHGTITNLDVSTVDLSFATVNILGPFTDDGGVLFFFNAPFTVASGDTSTPFDMFSITVPGSYAGQWGLQPAGTFTVFGSVEPDQSSDTQLGQTNFQISVTPEPGTFVLLGLALPVAAMLKRRLVR